MLSEADKAKLVEAARKARQTAYAKYSMYRVGAALLCEDGAIYPGCNVENAAYPQGTCAEAGAISAMALAGARTIVAVAVAGGRSDGQPETDPWDLCSPCGGCRQRIAEFAQGAGTPIIIASPESVMLESTIGELFPHAFNLVE
jgi:cytidine deaminase